MLKIRLIEKILHGGKGFVENVGWRNSPQLGTLANSRSNLDPDDWLLLANILENLNSLKNEKLHDRILLFSIARSVQ